MSEELWEQVAYGDHCKHGTSIGTPGGADLMCQWCELGFDTWVDDPRYTLYLGINQEPDPVWRGIKQMSWRESDIHLTATHYRLEQAADQFSRVAEEAGLTLHWWVVREDGGYWDE